MNYKWSDTRNRASVELIRNELFIYFNCSLRCSDFYSVWETNAADSKECLEILIFTSVGLMTWLASDSLFDYLSVITSGVVKRLPSVLFLLTDRFLSFFAPQRRHVAPIKVKFGREKRTVRSSPISCYAGKRQTSSDQNSGLQIPQT